MFGLTCKISGEIEFSIETVKVGVNVEGVAIDATFKDVTQAGIAEGTLVSCDHPVIAKFIEDDSEVTDEEESFYEKFIDAVCELDGTVGPTIQCRMEDYSEMLLEALHELEYEDVIQIGKALGLEYEQRFKDIEGEEEARKNLYWDLLCEIVGLVYPRTAYGNPCTVLRQREENK